MVLDRLILTNFKNYAEADIGLCGNINCFVGNNGAGKTNLLDAVYYLAFCKSYFNPADSQNIRLGADFFAIHGHCGPEVVSCTLRQGQAKQMRWNKKLYKTLAEHIGKLPLVMVSPNDQQLIAGGSELRRRFADSVISQVDHDYLNHLIAYNKALDQRNRLLKQMWDDRQWDAAMVALWDAQLVQHGEPIYAGREAFIAGFQPLFEEYYHWIAGTAEPGAITYQRDTRPLAQQLEAARQADRYAQHTTVGPHKDDFLLSLSAGMPVKRFGSQGQQKSFALALKLAQFQYLLNHSGQKPILLLDDIFDKLDLDRIRQLIALVGSDRFGQVLLTDTQPGRVQALFNDLPHLEHRLFHVAQGHVSLTTDH